MVVLKTQGVSRPIVLSHVEATCTRLRRRQLVGSHSTAIETIKLVREVVASATFSSFEQLCLHVQEIGQLLESCGPKEVVISNSVRRILKLLREEYATALTVHLSQLDSGSTTPVAVEGQEFPTTLSFSPINIPPPTPSTDFTSSPPREGSTSMTTIFDLLGHGRGGITRFNSITRQDSFDSAHHSKIDTSPLQLPLSSGGESSSSLGYAPCVTPRKNRVEAELEFSCKSHTLKPIFIDAIQELVDEVEHVREEVAGYAIEHVHSSECIMTMGHSRTVEAFLKAAARKLKFTVIAAETAPSFSGQHLATSLGQHYTNTIQQQQQQAAIDTLLVPDSAVFALMSRCSKVVIGCQAVLADGSLLARSGTLNMVMAAQAHLVPVVVVAGMYKFTSDYLGGMDDVGNLDLKNPDQVLKVEAWCSSSSSDGGSSQVEVLNPYYERIPSELISLFVTNAGGQPPSLIFRLLTDLYGSG